MAHGCIVRFQRLDGEATREGLWLFSTITNRTADRFRVRALQPGRELASQANPVAFSAGGAVAVVEEYTVGVDGVQQDFVVMKKPEGAGRLQGPLNYARRPSSHRPNWR
jgi:hypothetical protein